VNANAAKPISAFVRLMVQDQSCYSGDKLNYINKGAFTMNVTLLVKGPS